MSSTKKTFWLVFTLCNLISFAAYGERKAEPTYVDLSKKDLTEIFVALPAVPNSAIKFNNDPEGGKFKLVGAMYTECAKHFKFTSTTSDKEIAADSKVGIRVQDNGKGRECMEAKIKKGEPCLFKKNCSLLEKLPGQEVSVEYSKGKHLDIGIVQAGNTMDGQPVIAEVEHTQLSDEELAAAKAKEDKEKTDAEAAKLKAETEAKEAQLKAEAEKKQAEDDKKIKQHEDKLKANLKTCLCEEKQIAEARTSLNELQKLGALLDLDLDEASKKLAQAEKRLGLANIKKQIQAAKTVDDLNTARADLYQFSSREGLDAKELRKLDVNIFRKQIRIAKDEDIEDLNSNIGLWANDNVDNEKLAAALTVSLSERVVSIGNRSQQSYKRASELIGDAQQNLANIDDQERAMLLGSKTNFAVQSQLDFARTGNVNSMQFTAGYTSMMFNLNSTASVSCNACQMEGLNSSSQMNLSSVDSGSNSNGFLGSSSANCNVCSNTMNAMNELSQVPQVAQEAAKARAAREQQMREVMAKLTGGAQTQNNTQNNAVIPNTAQASNTQLNVPQIGNASQLGFQNLTNGNPSGWQGTSNLMRTF